MFNDKQLNEILEQDTPLTDEQARYMLNKTFYPARAELGIALYEAHRTVGQTIETAFQRAFWQTLLEIS
jgi:hypothetical protein